MKYLISILALISFSAHAQEVSEYKASNGITYHIGDTIKLGRGTGVQGSFVYVTLANFLMMSHDPAQNSVANTYTGLNVRIKKINRYTKRGQDLTTFVTSTIAPIPVKVAINIESAISVCEIAACNADKPIPVTVVNQPDKYDRLKKLKELLDNGTLNQAEYDSEKAKILADN